MPLIRKNVPVVNFFAILAADHLWGKIHGGALRLVLEFFFLENFSNPEVDQLDAPDVLLLF